MAKTKALLENHDACMEIWNTLDFNGNHIVSVAETDKFIGENQDNWDGAFKPIVDANTGKPKQAVLIRAWKKATAREYTSHDDGFIHKHEFKVFIRFIFM